MKIKMPSIFERFIGQPRAVTQLVSGCACLSSAGGREENQDSAGDVLLDSGLHLYLVADGLGGHVGGALASQLAVETVVTNAREYLLFSTEGLDDLKTGAQSALKQRQQEQPEFERMRTTLVMLAIHEGQAIWLHCGDVRLYHFRDGKRKLQTRDHSVPQMLVSSGDMEASEIRGHPDRNRVLRALGGDDNEARCAVSKAVATLQPGDAFLLCTDGFWEYVLESEMETTLQQTMNPAAWLRAMEKILLDKAEGEFDNYTALAVTVGADDDGSLPCDNVSSQQAVSRPRHERIEEEK